MATGKLFEHRLHRHQPRNVNELHAAERQGINARIAVAVTKAFGSMGTFYALVLWMLIWIALASGGVWLFGLDHYPFAFLLFLSNLVQLWALPVLAVGQNVLNRKATLQADEDFKINQASFEHIGQIMAHLDSQDQELLRLIKLVEGRQ